MTERKLSFGEILQLKEDNKKILERDDASHPHYTAEMLRGHIYIREYLIHDIELADNEIDRLTILADGYLDSIATAGKEVERLQEQLNEARDLILRAYYDLSPIRAGNDTKARLGLYVAKTRDTQAALEETGP